MQHTIYTLYNGWQIALVGRKVQHTIHTLHNGWQNARASRKVMSLHAPQSVQDNTDPKVLLSTIFPETI